MSGWCERLGRLNRRQDRRRALNRPRNARRLVPPRHDLAVFADLERDQIAIEDREVEPTVERLQQQLGDTVAEPDDELVAERRYFDLPLETTDRDVDRPPG